jgi:UDP-glucose 4-epimerase
MLNNKIILITGGTGSFGRAFTSKVLKSFPKVKEIRIFSRDEKKQYDMRKDFSHNKIKFFIGDVRDVQSLEFAFVNVDFVFHAAALKQVPSCEFYPLDAVKTNVLGTQNILSVSEKYGIKKVVCLSTDKAVNPINAMGMSKAIMEKVVVSHSMHKKKQFHV